MKKKNGSGGIRTHASEETGALNQRLRPLGHAILSLFEKKTSMALCKPKKRKIEVFSASEILVVSSTPIWHISDVSQ